MEKKMYQVTENDYVTVNEIENFVLSKGSNKTYELIKTLNVGCEISFNAFCNSSEEVDDKLLDGRVAFTIAYMCEMYEMYKKYLEKEDYERAQAYLYIWDDISFSLGNENHYTYADNNEATEVN